MKRGFTLVELLAVILVVGFIAAIATPIFIKIINETKINSAGINITNYMKAVKLSIENYSSVNKGAIPAGTYKITNNGKSLTNDTTTIKVLAKGEKLESGTIIINENGEVILKNGVVKGINKIYNSIGKKTTSLNIVTNDSGLYKSDNGRYIYRGENPNNYIWLDENGDGINQEDKSELYRIISYEKDGTIKVIRNESIGNMEWDTSNIEIGTRQNENNTYCYYSIGDSTKYHGCNVWGNMKTTYIKGTLLNSNFHYEYYTNDSSMDLKPTTTDLIVIDEATLNKYLNNNWLSEKFNLNNYIENRIFNVGGPAYPIGYKYNGKGIEKEKYEESLSTWIGKVGLINITEYIEASLNSECISVYDTYYFNSKYYYKASSESSASQHNITDDWPCKLQNYLYKDYYQWTISTNAFLRNGVWYISPKGFVHGNNGTDPKFNVLPVFFIKSSIVLIGKGTMSDPFIIKQ